MQPLDFEERRVLEDLVEVLADADITYDGSTSLAAEVVKLWADFFDDTWVWGSKYLLFLVQDITNYSTVTPRIGAVFRAMATIYESDRRAQIM